jgi:hypothetical protein
MKIIQFHCKTNLYWPIHVLISYQCNLTEHLKLKFASTVVNAVIIATHMMENLLVKIKFVVLKIVIV